MTGQSGLKASSTMTTPRDGSPRRRRRGRGGGLRRVAPVDAEYSVRSVVDGGSERTRSIPRWVESISGYGASDPKYPRATRGGGHAARLAARFRSSAAGRPRHSRRRSRLGRETVDGDAALVRSAEECQGHETLAVVHPDLAEGAAHVARLVHGRAEVQAKEPRLEETLDGVAPLRSRESIEGRRARGGRGGDADDFAASAASARRRAPRPRASDAPRPSLFGRPWGTRRRNSRGDPPRGRCWPRGARRTRRQASPAAASRDQDREIAREDPHRHTRLPRARCLPLRPGGFSCASVFPPLVSRRWLAPLHGNQARRRRG